MPADHKPIVSVITVVYNAGDKIEKTIRSVVNFVSPSVEYIIIDGGSVDNTLSVISKYKDQLKTISEPDRGIYDAMNKGIDMACGTWLYFINTGDELLHLPMEILSRTDFDKSLLSFPVQLSDGSVKKPELNFKLNLTNTLPHQGIFYRTSQMTRYEIRYKVFADYHLNLSMFKKKSNSIAIFQDHSAVATHDLDGVSNSPIAFSELKQIIKQHGGLFMLALSLLYFKWRGLKRKLSKLK